jgi:hypothetical protein
MIITTFKIFIKIEPELFVSDFIFLFFHKFSKKGFTIYFFCCRLEESTEVDSR